MSRLKPGETIEKVLREGVKPGKFVDRRPMTLDSLAQFCRKVFSMPHPDDVQVHEGKWDDQGARWWGSVYVLIWRYVPHDALKMACEELAHMRPAATTITLVAIGRRDRAPIERTAYESVWRLGGPAALLKLEHVVMVS